MKKEIYVIGHKNPDTDSVVSAIVFSDYLQKKGFKSIPVVAGKTNKETNFVLSLAKEKKIKSISSAGSKKFFLVDHGNLEEAVNGLKSSSIFGVLDHHKMSGISTDSPIFYRCEPLGSTSTLVFKVFQEENINLSKKQALLLLCGIVSDTLMLSSPTTTKEDEKTVRVLAKKAGTQTKDLTKDLFKAKSDISGMKVKDILLADYKEYDFSNAKIGVGVYETTDASVANEIKDKIFKEIPRIKKEKKIDFLFFSVIDILTQECFFYLDSLAERETAQKAFGGKRLEEGILAVPGIVSRKKQIVPPLSKILN